jgi:hypothetical protein
VSRCAEQPFPGCGTYDHERLSGAMGALLAGVGKVANVRDAAERQHVVLAQRPEGDVPGQHELVVPLVIGERGEVERVRAERLRVAISGKLCVLR